MAGRGLHHRPLTAIDVHRPQFSGVIDAENLR
jgi:hypothetical protein